MPPDHLAGAAQAKRSDALARAEAALRELDGAGEPVSFQALARRARVSRQWLYKQPALRAEIERLRSLGPTAKPTAPAAEQASRASLTQRVESLLDENRRLRREMTELKQELGLAYGHQRTAS